MCFTQNAKEKYLESFINSLSVTSLAGEVYPNSIGYSFSNSMFYDLSELTIYQDGNIVVVFLSNS